MTQKYSIIVPVFLVCMIVAGPGCGTVTQQPVYVFPGCFCPPTVGHLYVVKKAAAFLPEVTIVCSSNPEKKNPWFTQEECKKLWLSYPLPANVSVATFAEMEPHIKDLDLVMIRGIRDEKDYDDEKKVLFYNAHHYNISKVLYIVHDKPEEQFCSSTKVRALAEDLNLEELGNYVSPLVLSALLEKVLKIKNIFMVVGKAGSGKSTFLKMLHEIDPRNVYINTDELNHELRPLIREHFKGENLIDVALHKEDELLKLITHPWLELLKTRLKSVPPDSNVFLEIAYGLQPNKNMYHYVGGKVLYIGCKQETNIARNKQRGTPHLQAFIDRVPDLEATQKIAKEQQLELMSINTDCSLADLHYQAQQFNTLVWI